MRGEPTSWEMLFIRIPAELREALLEEAERDERSGAAMARVLLREALDAREEARNDRAGIRLLRAHPMSPAPGGGAGA